MSGIRPGVRRPLAHAQVRTVVVEHWDRFRRVNTELVEAALSAHGRDLVALNPKGLDESLVRDMSEVLTSFCALMHGHWLARDRAEKALRGAARRVGPEAAG